MVKNGYNAEFPERIFSQIRGFGEYGFPDSYVASFAKLVCVSCCVDADRKLTHGDAA